MQHSLVIECGDSWLDDQWLCMYISRRRFKRRNAYGHITLACRM